MISLTEQEFKILVDLVNRVPKTSGEVYACEMIVQKVQAQVDEEKARNQGELNAMKNTKGA